MKKITHLTSEIINNESEFNRFLQEIRRPCENETQHYFDEAQKMGASYLQLFNLAGACYANQKTGGMREVDINNFDTIVDENEGNFNLPKNNIIKIYRGLYLDWYDEKIHSNDYVKNHIYEKVSEFQSWTINKNVAKFFAHENGVILETEINTNASAIVGLNVFGMLAEGEIILMDDDLDFKLEPFIDDKFQVCWGEAEKWNHHFFK